MMKRGKGLLLCVMFVFAIWCRGGVVQAQYENETSGETGNNYGYEGKMNSYLDVREDGTISRIEARGSSIGVLIENYDASFQLLSSKTLSYELPLLGGFYSSDEYYFLVFGDSNTDESDEKEVLRVVKYDKEWNRLGYDSVYGGNTYVMFASAGMDMADDGSLLYIRTGHTMYTSDDGYNHQASVMAEVDMATCTINKCLYGILNVAYGYVSHSFNEKLVYDTDTASLYSSDLGDAYPRYNVVHKYLSIGSTYSSTKTKYLSALDYGGTTGNNYTGSTLGGLTAGSGNLLVAGSTIDQSNFSTAKSRNVYVTVIDTSSFTKTKTTYFTEYDDGDNEGRVSAPQLVKINDNKFLLLWETTSMSGTYSGKINYVYIDANADALSEVQSLEGSIAKCQPVVYQNQVVWYYAKNTSPVFYCLPTNPSETVDAPETGYQATYGNVLYEVSGEGTVKIAGYGEDLSGALTIPSTVSLGGYSYQVTGIEKEAFKDSKITSITIPAEITEIGENILQGCTSLKRVDNQSEVEVALPDNLESENSHFVMWYTGSSYTPITSIGTGVAVAYFTNTTYTIKFDSRGGSEVSDQMVYAYGYGSEPEAPVKEGYVLEGWYTSTSYTTKWVFNQDRRTYSTTVTLYAKWVEDTTEKDDSDTSGGNDNTPDDNQNTSDDKQNTPGGNDNTPDDNQNTSDDKQNTLGGNDNTSGDNQNTSDDKQNTPGGNDNTPDDNQNTSDDKQNTPGGNDNTPIDDDDNEAVDMMLFAKLKNVSKVAVTSSYKLAPKKSMQLSVTFLPEGASAESLTYKSSNPGIAKISASGKITAGKKAGTTTITVTSENGIKKYLKVQVMKKPVSKIRIKTSKTTVKVNKTVKMKAIISPGKKIASTGVFWKSSNPKVATVSTSGKVKGVKKGTAKITATATDGSGKKAVIRIKVK